MSRAAELAAQIEAARAAEPAGTGTRIDIQSGDWELITQGLRVAALINHPEVDDFFAGVRQEAAHQVERWGAEHDSGKDPQDWFWLIGYLGGKCLRAAIDGDRPKALHHTISTAAACLNWHAQISGRMNLMRPGIEEPQA